MMKIFALFLFFLLPFQLSNSFNYYCNNKVNILQKSLSIRLFQSTTSKSLSSFSVLSSILIASTTFIPALSTAQTDQILQSTSSNSDSFSQKKPIISRAKLQLPDQELQEVFQEARKDEINGNYDAAKRLYTEIIESEPDFLFSYTSLGNIYANEGNFYEALSYLNKAIALLPPIEPLITILVTKGTIESNLQSFSTALQNLEIAENLLKTQSRQLVLSSPWQNPNYKLIQINKAVIYSRTNQWQQAYDCFDQVLYNAAEREVSPWVIRYVLASLEISSPFTTNANEAAPISSPITVSQITKNFLERLLIRFPQVAEVNALATSVYSLLNDYTAAKDYWKNVPVEEQENYKNLAFLQKTVNWGPIARKGIQLFVQNANKENL